MSKKIDLYEIHCLAEYEKNKLNKFDDLLTRLTIKLQELLDDNEQKGLAVDSLKTKIVETFFKIFNSTRLIYESTKILKYELLNKLLEIEQFRKASIEFEAIEHINMTLAFSFNDLQDIHEKLSKYEEIQDVSKVSSQFTTITNKFNSIKNTNFGYMEKINEIDTYVTNKAKEIQENVTKLISVIDECKEMNSCDDPIFFSTHLESLNSHVDSLYHNALSSYNSFENIEKTIKKAENHIKEATQIDDIDDELKIMPLHEGIALGGSFLTFLAENIYPPATPFVILATASSTIKVSEKPDKENKLKDYLIYEIEETGPNGEIIKDEYDVEESDYSPIIDFIKFGLETFISFMENIWIK